MPKMKQHDSFAEWKKDQSKVNQKLISSLEKLIQTISPNLIKSVKWGQGCFINIDKAIMYIHTEPDYIQLGFYNGSSLNDPLKLLKGKGKYIRFIIIKNNTDINIKTFTALINQVV